MSEKPEPTGIVGAPATWSVKPVQVEKLVLIQMGPGAYIKLTETEARARGLLPEPEPLEKAMPPAPNKARGRPRNKARQDT